MVKPNEVVIVPATHVGKGKSLVFTPECDKLLAVVKESQAIGAFLDWLESERGLMICQLEGETQQYFPAYLSINQILAEYFDIDLNKVEKEKEAILDGMRSAHAGAK